ncbi:MAG TPA: glycosyltransferase [Candidatus Latescibacteria bacterium]|nr:glycosyltransferase [Candidatus Latescibacterota bacterium]
MMRLEICSIWDFTVRKEIRCFHRPPRRHKAAITRALDFLFGPPYYVQDFWSEDMASAIKEAISKEKFDLVHFDLIGVAQYVDCVGSVPKVFTAHDIFFIKTKRYLKAEQPLIDKLGTFRDCLKFHLYEPRIYKKFDHVIVTSEEDALHLRRRCPGLELSVVPNGVDTEFYRPWPDQEEDHILVYTGTMNNLANTDAMVHFVRDVLPYIKERVPNVKLYVVGRDPSEPVKRLPEEDSSVAVTGEVEDVRPYMARAGVYVVPLRIGSGTRLKILEALAMEKAVVSTPVGCEGLRVRHGREVLVAEGPRKFASYVVRLMKDKDLRRRLGRNGRRLVEREYDWRICARRLERTLKEVSNRS